jgi:hypothetical protein
MLLSTLRPEMQSVRRIKSRERVYHARGQISGASGSVKSPLHVSFVTRRASGDGVTVHRALNPIRTANGVRALAKVSSV